MLIFRILIFPLSTILNPNTTSYLFSEKNWSIKFSFQRIFERNLSWVHFNFGVSFHNNFLQVGLVNGILHGKLCAHWSLAVKPNNIRTKGETKQVFVGIFYGLRLRFRFSVHFLDRNMKIGSVFQLKLNSPDLIQPKYRFWDL